MFLRDNFKQLINLIFYISKNSYYSFNCEQVKKIFEDELTCISNEETKIKRMSDSLIYLLGNINQSFDKDILNKAYFLLSNKFIDITILNKIIELYYKNIDAAPQSLSALLHLYIINNIEKDNIEFAFLIVNYIMLKKGRWFLMPCECCHNEYKVAIENNDLSSLIRIFYDIELVKKEKVPCLLSRDEVIQKVKSIKKDLLNNYKIEKLYLFGSYAKGKNTEKSDLDFIVIFNESLINKEKNDMIRKMKKYLSIEFNCDVDLLDFSYALDTFDKSQMEYLISLI
jgi:hypothetical protein